MSTDMSPEAIRRRLQRVGELSPVRRFPEVDMTSEAVDRRLRTVEQLRRLCARLGAVDEPR